jgi:hypothetical protein
VAIAGLSFLLIKNEWMPSCLAMETHQTPGLNLQPLAHGADIREHGLE